MIKSMTGYGKSVVEVAGRKYNIEIKTLNSKQADINCRIPQQLKEKELEIRTMLSAHLMRGKIELGITPESNGPGANFSINKPLAKQFYTELMELQQELNPEARSDILSALVRIPDVLVPEKNKFTEEDWLRLKQAVEKAISLTNKFREHEGEALEQDMKHRIKIIRQLLLAIEPFEKDRLTFVRQRLLKELKSLGEDITVDENRLEQELLYYLEKLDITEEKVRLAKHLDYFEEVITKEDSCGKKLGFIAQEIGREINTIGSKASDADIQKIAVQLKDELEKIREQLMNIL